MKKFMMVAITLIATTVINAQSIGALGGGSVDKLGVGSSWGAWLDFGGIGFHYVTTGSLNNNPSDVINYVAGNTNTYTAGVVSESYGMFFGSNKKAFYAGGGVQVVRRVDAKDFDVVLESNHFGYGLVGCKFKLGKAFEGRLEGVIGKVSSVNLGLGISLK